MGEADMTILVDFSGVFMAAIHTDLKSNDDLNEDFIRHLVLNRVRSFNKKYRGDYGEMIICLDNTHNGNFNWRYDYFKHYKANRKAGREASKIDWGKVYEIVSTIVEEMRTYVPMKIVDVPKCEADDLIGRYCENKPDDEKVMIVSGDKDFKQLQRYPNVKQFSPIVNKQLVEPKPLQYIKEHVIRGDGGDGVPNILSPEDVLVTEGTRQTPVRKKWLDEVLTKPLALMFGDDDEIKKRYVTNAQMIDLSLIPDAYKALIDEAFENAKPGNGRRLYSYFIKKRMKLMQNYIDDFFTEV